jgi:hypothetical protein
VAGGSEFGASLGYTERPYLKRKRKKKFKLGITSNTQGFSENHNTMNKFQNLGDKFLEKIKLSNNLRKSKLFYNHIKIRRKKSLHKENMRSCLSYKAVQ